MKSGGEFQGYQNWGGTSSEIKREYVPKKIVIYTPGTPEIGLPFLVMMFINVACAIVLFILGKDPQSIAATCSILLLYWLICHFPIKGKPPKQWEVTIPNDDWTLFWVKVENDTITTKKY